METKTSIEFNGDGISVEFPVYVKEVGTKFLCYIPGFELTFTADRRDEIDTLSTFMVKCFVHQYGTDQNGLGLLIKDLQKFGFNEQKKQKVSGMYKSAFAAGKFMPPVPNNNVRFAISA